MNRPSLYYSGVLSEWTSVRRLDLARSMRKGESTQGRLGSLLHSKSWIGEESSAPWPQEGPA